MALITFKDYSFAYEGSSQWNLNKINFTLEKGEILTLMGCNGAGKTTSCLAAAGFLPSFYHGRIKGELTIFNESPSSFRSESIQSSVGLLLQNPAAQLSRMKENVLEEVIFGLENFSYPQSEMENRAEKALKLVGLKGMEKRDPLTLSGGEQQRLTLASILVLDRDILILDEPISQLNPSAKLEFYELFNALKIEGKTLMISSMDALISAEFSDKILLIEEGIQLAWGSPESVLNSKSFLKSGISQTPFFDCRDAIKTLTGSVPAGTPGFTLDQAYGYFNKEAERGIHVTGH